MLWKFLGSSPFSHIDISTMSKFLGRVPLVSSHLLFHVSFVLWQDLSKREKHDAKTFCNLFA